MKRTVFGTLFGQIGAYISQPGDDLDNPQKSLLLDSRSAHTLNVHFTERVRLNVANNFNNTFRYWLPGGRSFPALEYLPQYHVSLMLWQSDIATYPGLSGIRNRTLNDVELSVTSSQIFLDMAIGGAEMDLDLTYVIYRNPR
jgi:hypothetical protein